MSKPLSTMEGLFKALGDATRLRILGLLLTGEVCVCHIHDALNIPQSKASRHLAYLRRMGLVDTRRAGQWIFYRLGALPEPAMEAIYQTVRHALTHMAVIQRDASRITKKTGSCLPEGPGGSFPCCSSPTVVGVTKRAAPLGTSRQRTQSRSVAR
jgi:ArsR family transcriptional regulator, arsenate/arsenite/antimonite-responsive transcriptional repressor